jgi:hypothetical protein
MILLFIFNGTALHGGSVFDLKGKKNEKARIDSRTHHGILLCMPHILHNR